MVQKDPVFSDVFRIRRNGDTVELSFGEFTGKPSELTASVSSEQVREVANIHFNVDLLHIMATRLVQTGISYQQETKKDLGFKVPAASQRKKANIEKEEAQR